MSDHSSNPPEEGSWKEVGQQFQALGETLAAAFRSAWKDETNRQRMEEVRSGVEAMVASVSQAVREGAESPEGQQVRQEAERAAESLRKATSQAVQDARPHLVSALQQVNSELQRMIEKMQQKPD
ncbi:MAG TPA: hypothetical protein VIO61_00780 [Anaerolineaceae bacterium]